MGANNDFDLEPLIHTNERRPAKRLLRRTSGTFSSLRRYRCLMLALISMIILSGFFLMYHCPDYYCFAQKATHTIAPPPAPLQIDINFVSYDTIQHENFEFNINGSDVMVFLHIQKTGGTTFGKHLVQDIDLESPCACIRRPKKKHKKKKSKHHRNVRRTIEEYDRPKRKLKCDCFRPNGQSSNWLFSRYSTGWKCGLHPDWTELTECVDGYLDSVEKILTQRRYFYITFLRNPVGRYLSEFRHVQRGATWKTSLHKCNGKPATRDQLPPCYDDVNRDDWEGVGLEEFMDCPFNLATNRQTRMLADLKLVNCYDTTTMSQKARDLIMLNSAKTNLEKMAFFGLTEKQHESQVLFQNTFDLQFKKPFVQFNETTSSKEKHDLDQDTIDRITEMNHLDVELYEFAKTLLEKRVQDLNTNLKEDE